MQVPSQLAGSSQNAGSPPRAGLGGGGPSSLGTGLEMWHNNQVDTYYDQN